MIISKFRHHRDPRKLQASAPGNLKIHALRKIRTARGMTGRLWVAVAAFASRAFRATRNYGFPASRQDPQIRSHHARLGGETLRHRRRHHPRRHGDVRLQLVVSGRSPGG